MQRLSTDKLQTGMVLGSDVKDLSGRMLLKSDTVIEEKHLRVLRTWGVLAVDVQIEGEADTEQPTLELNDLPADVIAEIESEVERRFSAVDSSHPVMAALAELVKSRLATQYQSGQLGE
jgi:hypothetical protein